MKRVFANFVLPCFLFSVLLSACGTIGVLKPAEMEKKETEPPVKVKKEYIPTDEETRSLEIFEEILDVFETTEDRQAAVLKAEVLYNKIITGYPDSPLAQESYWKLITMCLEEHSPPDFEKAETYYYEFIKKYPASVLKGVVENTLANSYIKYLKWEDLLRLTTPVFKKFDGKGEHPAASMMFMYSEANYNLGNIREAEEGYAIVLELFPQLIYGKKAKSRLEEITQKKN